jgi:tripartite-type tricarboxylate transporter receptor subunit TctC
LSQFGAARRLSCQTSSRLASGYDVTHAIWHTLMVPSGTPPDVVAKLRQGLKGMVEDEAFKALMGKLGERVQYMSGEDFEKFWEDDYKKVGALLKQIIKK